MKVKDFNAYPGTNQDLSKIAYCYMSAFPNSLATKLGKKYVMKTLEWFLKHNDCALYWIRNEEGKCIGFVGAKQGHGSTSGMIQYAFWQGINAVLLKPWLLFTAEVRNHFPLIITNIKQRIFGRKIQKKNFTFKQKSVIPSVGLVVIGVNVEFQGKGYGKLLLSVFDEITCKFGSNKAHLSVKRYNTSAISAYQKCCWSIISEDDQTYIMTKKIICNKEEVI